MGKDIMVIGHSKVSVLVDKANESGSYLHIETHARSQETGLHQQLTTTCIYLTALTAHKGEGQRRYKTAK